MNEQRATERYGCGEIRRADAVLRAEKGQWPVRCVLEARKQTVVSVSSLNHPSYELLDVLIVYRTKPDPKS